jgi:hypothetical protein
MTTKCPGIFAAIALGAVLLAAHPATALNLIVNPGFETGDFTGWSATGIASVSAVPNTGDWAALMAAPQFGSGSISQVFSTVASSTYDLDFWVGGNSRSSQFLSVSWDGSPVLNLNINGFTAYTHYAFSGLTASSGITELKFSYAVSGGYVQVDDVNVDGLTGVPEPATLLLFGPGALLFASKWRRKRAAR